MNGLWPAFRLVDAGWASLTELKTTWTFSDLVDANETLDSVLEARAAARPKK